MTSPRIKQVVKRQRSSRLKAKRQNQDPPKSSSSKKRSASSLNVDHDDSHPSTKRRAVLASEAPNVAARNRPTTDSNIIDLDCSDSDTPLLILPPGSTSANQGLHSPQTSVVYVADRPPVHLRFGEPDPSNMEELSEPKDQRTGSTSNVSRSPTDRMAAAAERFAKTGTILEITVNQLLEAVGQMTSAAHRMGDGSDKMADAADRMADAAKHISANCNKIVWKFQGNFREVPGAMKEDSGITASGQEADDDNSSHNSERTASDNGLYEEYLANQSSKKRSTKRR